MPRSFSRTVALKYLWSRRSEAFITIITAISVLGIAVGVMVINIVMAVMTGFEHELREKIVGTTSHITLRNLRSNITGWRDLAVTVGTVDGVASVSPYTYNQALLRIEDRSTGILIRGIDPASDAAELSVEVE